MWDFFETVRHRHSVRKYQSDMPVDDKKLHAILEMACAAPSAGDLQAYSILVVRNPKQKKALSTAANNQEFVNEAPVCLVFCADPDKSANEFGDRGRDLYAVQDATIAAAYAQLAVVSAGMGSTWVGQFDEARVIECLQLEPQFRIIALISVGYPAEIPQQSPRQALDDVVKYLD